MEGYPAEGLSRPVTQRRRVDLDRAAKWLGIVQSCVVIASVVCAGIWAITQFRVLLQARIASAQAEKAEAEATLARRVATQKVILLVGVSASVLSAPEKGCKDECKWWVKIDVNFRNVGSEPIRLNLDEAMRFYIVRITGDTEPGILTYAKEYQLKFDYLERTLSYVYVRPSNEPRTYSTVRAISKPGIYLVRFSVPAADEGAQTKREYGAQAFIQIS